MALNWTNPRPHTDESLRLHHYGPLEPMLEYHSRRDFVGTIAVLILGVVAVVGFAIILGWIK